jgi:hypothetical protein
MKLEVASATLQANGSGTMIERFTENKHIHDALKDVVNTRGSQAALMRLLCLSCLKYSSNDSLAVLLSPSTVTRRRWLAPALSTRSCPGRVVVAGGAAANAGFLSTQLKRACEIRDET